jgi:hypothetical protein
MSSHLKGWGVGVAAVDAQVACTYEAPNYYLILLVKQTEWSETAARITGAEEDLRNDFIELVEKATPATGAIRPMKKMPSGGRDPNFQFSHAMKVCTENVIHATASCMNLLARVDSETTFKIRKSGPASFQCMWGEKVLCQMN